MVDTVDVRSIGPKTAVPPLQSPQHKVLRQDDVNAAWRKKNYTRLDGQTFLPDVVISPHHPRIKTIQVAASLMRSLPGYKLCRSFVEST